MAAGSFTLTRRNNKSGYVIIRTMQRATVRYENIDCLCRTCDAALLLFDVQLRLQRATIWCENVDKLYPTYDAAVLLFGMNQLR